MSALDPKIFFSNERTFLKWMHTSVTLGSVATGILGVSATVGSGLNPLRCALARATSRAADSRAQTTHARSVVGLLLLVLSIVITAHALMTFHERARLLNMRRTDGFESTSAPVAIALCLIFALVIVYVSAIMKKTAAEAPPPLPAT